MKNQYLLVGSGRTAQHFAEYCRLLQQPFTTWSRKQFASNSDQKNAEEDLDHKISQSSHVLLLISDSAIKNFVQSHPELKKKTLVHFSGALEIPGVISAHPLMTFGSELYSLETYQKIPFVLTGSEAFSDVLPGFPNKAFFISPNEKAYYHALCVMSGNFTTLLWQKMREGLQDLNLPPDLANAYLEQTTKNILSQPKLALTGPLARKDFVTIESNLEALKQHQDSFEKIYRAFTDVVLGAEPC